MLNHFIPKKDDNREKVYQWIMDPANEHVREALWQRLSQEQRDHLMNEMQKEVVRKNAITVAKDIAVFASIFALICGLAVLSVALSDTD